MQIVFIRHSMTAGNLERRYIGCRTDEPLCEAGISLAQQKTAEIRQTFPMPEVVLTSPMRRCVQTAEILFSGHAERNSIWFAGVRFRRLLKGRTMQNCPEIRRIRHGSTAAERWLFPAENPERHFCSDAVRHWNRLCSGSSIR